jgi:5-methylcytosine-specific restriction endonuclease McrA
MTRKKRPEFPSDIKKKVIERSGNRCERCCIDFDDEFKGIFHHIMPVVFGGKNNIENCSLLCKNCHRIAPNIRSEEELLMYNHYFLRFASFKEATQYYRTNNKFDLHIKAALDVAKRSKKKF